MKKERTVLGEYRAKSKWTSEWVYGQLITYKSFRGKDKYYIRERTKMLSKPFVAINNFHFIKPSTISKFVAMINNEEVYKTIRGDL